MKTVQHWQCICNYSRQSVTGRERHCWASIWKIRTPSRWLLINKNPQKKRKKVISKRHSTLRLKEQLPYGKYKSLGKCINHWSLLVWRQNEGFNFFFSSAISSWPACALCPTSHSHAQDTGNTWKNPSRHVSGIDAILHTFIVSQCYIYSTICTHV